jgi:hypothetical protein
MAELVKIFSDPNLPTKPRFRCGVEGPDSLTSCSSQLWKSSSAIVSTSNGSGVFINSDLFPEFRVSGKCPKRRRENHLRTTHPRKRGAPIDFLEILSCLFHPARFRESYQHRVLAQWKSPTTNTAVRPRNAFAYSRPLKSLHISELSRVDHGAFSKECRRILPAVLFSLVYVTPLL